MERELHDSVELYFDFATAGWPSDLIEKKSNVFALEVSDSVIIREEMETCSVNRGQLLVLYVRLCSNKLPLVSFS